MPPRGEACARLGLGQKSVRRRFEVLGPVHKGNAGDKNRAGMGLKRGAGGSVSA